MHVYSKVDSSVCPMYLHILFIYYVSWCLFSMLLLLLNFKNTDFSDIL